MASTNRLSPIPHPPTKPVVGNMLSLDSTAPVQNLARLAKELGPIFWLDMMGAPIVIVSGHDLVEELSDEKRFDKAVRGPLRRVRAIAGDGLFTADTTEPNWGKAHNILLQPFGNRAMQSYHPSMVDIADQLVKKWERLNGDEEIDVVHDMTALTLDTIGLCGFDYRFNSFYRRDYHPFVESLVRSLETIMMIRGLPMENLWMRKRRRGLAGDVAFMNKMVDEIVAERRKNAEAAADKKDMLGAMMTGVDRSTGEQLDDVNIRYQINTFLIAGHETTSGLLSCTLYALLKHPDVLKKAYEEVDRVLGPDIDTRPTYQQVTQLTYITQILKEALRLWPPAPAYGISPLKDETIGGKYKLKKNTFVTVLVLALHRDPSVWGPNPDAFDPENFSREAEAARPVNAWKPFGNGQRACIGRGFAMHEAALAIGMILQRFKLIDHHRYQINTFLIAGHETTSGLLSCTLYALLKHPDILKKAYEEVDRVLGPDVDARPTYQQVTQLTYITQILKEALRLWPPAPAYGIAPLQDETIGGKYKLRKNTFVTVLVMALHRDPSVWGPNPDAFDPENFSREAEAARPVNAWKPFGNGQRACIGRGFAMHEAALAIGMILQRFKLVDIHRYQMQLKETLTI
ncbi:MAG: cytochrome / NADPH-cytochrome reductase, partial [Bradyrhizobium sp.]|nr:cytochrome / NADPH-cytochrome reductase [Bradyrhizobium sp.]